MCFDKINMSATFFFFFFQAKAGKKGVDGGYSCRGLIDRIDDTTVSFSSPRR